jgi:hypothetical protein
MWTWIKTQMLGGFEGIKFSKEPIVWLASIAAIANLVIAIIQGDLSLWPDGIESIGIILGGLIGRGTVKPLAKLPG